MMARAAEGLHRDLVPRGMKAFTVGEGLAVLERLLDADVTQAVYMPVNWELWRASYPDAAASPLLSDLMAGGDDNAGSVGGYVGAVAEPPVRPPAVPATAPGTVLPASADAATQFLGRVATVLKTRPDELDPHRDLSSQGMDSPMAARLRQEVHKSCGVLLPIAVILSKATLAHLTDVVAADGAVVPTRAESHSR
jgi:aryl carrier-like protein